MSRARRAMLLTLRRATLLALAGLTGAGCGGPREAALPGGAYLFADGAALRTALTPLAELAGTPLGRFAHEARTRLQDCAAITAHAPEGTLGALADALVCAEPAAEPPAVARARGDRDWLLLVPVSGEARARVLGSLEGPGRSLAMDVALEGSAGALTELLLPAAEPAGPPVLSSAESLIHARLRPRGGLDLVAFVPEGSQGDRLFRLRSGLLSDAVLAGALEAVVYMPGEGDALPPLAAALDVRSERLAREAAERFIAELSAHWPVHRTPGRFAGRDGACLLDLRILPGFAPCYATTERALVLGWNPPSLERALARAPDEGERAREHSHLTAHLDRWPEADRRLARRPDAAARGYGWQSLELSPGGRGADWALRLVAAGPGPTP